MKNKKKIIYFFIIFLVGFDIGIILVYFNFQKYLTFNPEVFSYKNFQKTTHTDIDSVVNTKFNNTSYYSVVIDNHWAARPIYNLDKALLIYETLVEGGITRFLVFYPKNIKLENIGPIRSARPYFVNLGRFTYFIHSGGSNTALELLKKIDKIEIYNIDEISYLGDYFFRQPNRNSPHNLFISSENLEKIISNFKTGFLIDLKKENLEFGSIKQNSKCDDINIDFSLSAFKVLWKCINGEYLRYQGGKEFFYVNDKGEKFQVKSLNVVVLYTDISPEDKLHLKIKVFGKGNALICINGICKQGLWERENGDVFPKFFYKSGELVKFSKPPIWIEISQAQI